MFINWLQGTTNTTGNGPLAITTSSGFTNWGGLTNGTVVPYQLLASDGTSRESGLGTWSSGSLTRTTIRATLIGTTYNNTTATALNLPAGTHTVWSDITEVEATNWTNLTYNSTQLDGSISGGGNTVAVPSQFGFQRSSYTTATSVGTDTITASFTPAITSTTLTSGHVLLNVYVSNTNATATPTFAPVIDSSIAGAYIVRPNGSALIPGDLTAGQWAVLLWNSTTGKWILTNPYFGPGAFGGGNDRIFYSNDQTINNSFTTPSGQNCFSAGPITISTGITITVPSGGVWTII